MLTARNFSLAYFYPSGPFTCIFPKPLPISPVLAIANTWFLCRPIEINSSKLNPPFRPGSVHSGSAS